MTPVLLNLRGEVRTIQQFPAMSSIFRAQRVEPCSCGQDISLVEVLETMSMTDFTGDNSLPTQRRPLFNFLK
jgi:hypothetical protein